MLPFVGPAYQIATRKADVQRTLNMFLRSTESGTGKPATQFFLEQIPGLTVFATLGAEFRGGVSVGERCFIVAGPTLYEVSAAGTLNNRGTLLTSTGIVDMAEGLSQLVIVDGPYGYAYNLATNLLSTITSPAFYGSTRVGFLDNYFIFIRPDTQQFYISAINDASSLDALDFASAEASPDDLVSLVVDHRELWLFGKDSTEVWYNSAGVDFPFSRNQGAFIEIGAVSAQSAQKIDNSVIWVGRDKNGAGIVYRAAGYQPMRVSTTAVEEALKGADLGQCRAYCYQSDGLSFYCLNAPGLSTTWAYELASGQWHERCEIEAGALAPHRALGHVFAHGKHFIGDETALYEFDSTKNTNAGDELYRERTSPHFATPEFEAVPYGMFRLDATVGVANQGEDPQVELCWSNDGGQTFGNWLARPLGKTGKYQQRVDWYRLGASNDRVWKLRCTADVKFDIVNVAVF